MAPKARTEARELAVRASRASAIHVGKRKHVYRALVLDEDVEVTPALAYAITKAGPQPLPGTRLRRRISFQLRKQLMHNKVPVGEVLSTQQDDARDTLLVELPLQYHASKTSTFVPASMLKKDDVQRWYGVRRDGGAAFIKRRVAFITPHGRLVGTVTDYNDAGGWYVIRYDAVGLARVREIWSAQHYLLHNDDTIDYYSTWLTHARRTRPDGASVPNNLIPKGKTKAIVMRKPPKSKEMHPPHASKSAKHQDIKTRCNAHIAKWVHTLCTGRRDAVHQVNALILDDSDAGTTKAIEHKLKDVGVKLNLITPNAFAAVDHPLAQHHDHMLGYHVLFHVQRFSLDAAFLDGTATPLGDETRNLLPFLDLTHCFVRQVFSREHETLLGVTICRRGINKNKMRAFVAAMKAVGVLPPDCDGNDITTLLDAFLAHLASHNSYHVRPDWRTGPFGPGSKMFTNFYLIRWHG